jgi:hypothetical protein
MQIRTGEGKSMILGAAAVMLSLLGFKVRTVCYSEYLSNRDFKLFEELFDRFGLKKFIKYSKITTFAEDSTAQKGDIRKLTERMLRGTLSEAMPPFRSGSDYTIESEPIKLKSLENADRLTKKQKVVDKPLLGGEKNSSGLESVCGEVDENNSSVTPSGSETEIVDASSSPICQQTKSGSVNSLLDGEKNSSGLESVCDEVDENNSSVTPSGSQTEIVDTSSSPICQQTKAGSVDSSAIAELKPVAALSVDFNQTTASCTGSSQAERKEVLLVDEVDVFFGSEFYGQTYNQVVEFREPEVAEILKRIWSAFDQGGRRLQLSDIKSMPEYSRLVTKLPEYLLDNEISLMLDQVRRVNDVPYYLDPETDRIGYKVMDYISYDVTYGYATIFAYLKESDSFRKKDTLANALVIPLSCGQFSYANISPYRIIGVSGTLQALGDYEKDVLSQYGLERSVFVPSVYGASNFQFDKAGDGIYFEKTQSDFYHRLCAEVTSVIKSKRAAIVFFRDRSKLDEFVASPTYRQLGRHKKLLTEDSSSLDKEYIINKAATAGQITLCTSVFGRGTDFFCKDEAVENNGGVHIIQTFLSEEISEEIQIQGRTARQGKQGTYQLVLLEPDLVSEFGVCPSEQDNIPKRNWYDWLCGIRDKHRRRQCKIIDTNLSRASEVDNATHEYFDSLLEGNTNKALTKFQSLYQTIKKPPYPSVLNLDLAFAIDITGSMTPFTKCLASTIQGLVDGQDSIVEKLKPSFLRYSSL